MAKSPNRCDLCDKEAIDEVSAKSTTTHEIRIDVCEEHLLEFKKLLRIFTQREFIDNDMATKYKPEKANDKR